MREKSEVKGGSETNPSGELHSLMTMFAHDSLFVKQLHCEEAV